MAPGYPPQAEGRPVGLGTLEILNCRIDNATLTAWKEHFAPPTQPFFVRRQFPLPSRSGARWLDSGAVREALSLSAHDTFATYEVTGTARHLLLLDESAFEALPPGLRTELLYEQLEVGRGSVYQMQDLTDHLTRSEIDQVAAASSGGLVVWWPGLFAILSGATQTRLLAEFASEDWPPCRRAELAAERWQQVERVLPGIPSRAGTFHPDSGPNCFGAVIEAFTGQRIARRTERNEFEAWLESRIDAPGAADDLGTVLLWRDDHNALQHAAVSLGDGYAFHKEAQTWWSPWQVVRLTDVIERWQDAGAMTSVRLAT